MKALTGFVAGAAACAFLLATGSPATAAEPSLSIDTRSKGVTVSPNLWGIFFEEINHSGDGGLYPELVQGGTFEDRSTKGWELSTKGAAKARMELDSTRPLNTAQQFALRLDIEKASASEPAVLTNSGYWGMAVKQGAKYRLSFFARSAQGFNGPVEARLESASGALLAKAAFTNLGSDWKRQEAVLAPSSTDAQARLVLSIPAAGQVWFDVVSLFPLDTWKHRPNGQRADLAEMLAALKPAFVRFPGGCFVEGGNYLKDASRWPKTMGPMAERPGHLNTSWNYWTLDGLGYHEYLQMVEDLGADSLFVVNVGMAHKESAPMNQLDEWLTEALNAVEYAVGPATSKYGAMRAKNGHPKPFALKYVEIGNENSGPAYAERYTVFYKALKAKYPALKLIANDERTGGTPYDIVDHHIYTSPDGIRRVAHRYDTYDRKLAKVFVGEYAVNQNVGPGNLRGALAESAYMMGLERNSDVVVMAAYAPLFWNVNDRKWPVNLIGFDGTRTFGTPSYYVQKLFAENRPETTMPVDLKVDKEKVSIVIDRGAVGVGTWNTEAEFKDLRVTPAAGSPFTPDLAKGLAAWRTTRGSWSLTDGVLRQSNGDNDARAMIGDAKWTDYTLSVKARKLSGAEGFLILFRAKDARSFYWLNLGGWGNSHTAIERSDRGGKVQLEPRADVRIETGRWYEIQVKVTGSRVECSLDGKRILDVPDIYGSVELPVMEAIAGRAKNGETVVKVVNFAASSSKVAMKLDGMEGKLTGTATVLAGDPEGTNSVDEPRKIAPVTSPVNGLTGPSFSYEFPANSLTVLRLKAAK